MAKTSDKNINLKKQELENEINEYVEMFNSICLQIGDLLTSEFPRNKNINICNDVVSNLIKKKPKETISVFLMKVYIDDKYRIAIENGDESFFKKSDHNHFTGNDQDQMNAILNFRECWDELSQQSQKQIKDGMKTLVNICELYVDLNDDLNKIKQSK